MHLTNIYRKHFRSDYAALTYENFSWNVNMLISD
ncbi:hypothetical protein TcasGA2_TC001264 [Tribolium castaneum]|uniref:Uncharacterized protein n=1 Tax=Tribolium castaneum TaxID=7070 RepID=A0A139WN20_TRICA|nr:hypothetical protein TcasGA2_TC001264 [Tribolium castaneum]